MIQHTVQTVTGPVAIESLGRTLMHEHLQVGAPGWETDTLEPGPAFRDLVARCVDQIEELKGSGYSSLVDPCPNDMGRDVALMREVAWRTGFNIICAAGFYHSEVGASAYWKVRLMLDPDAHKRIADLLVREISVGIDGTDVRAGILKAATGRAITPYEEAMMSATAVASVATGTPVTTHTEATLGEVQVDTFCRAGVDPGRVIVGHCCGSNDFSYHRAILERGAYIGFDRFGLESVNSDEQRAASLARLVHEGFGDRIVVSHDCVLCFRGMEALRDRFAPKYGMLRFARVIEPMLRQYGLDDHDLDRLTIQNPKRFFQGAAL